MRKLFFENALLPSGWARNVLIKTNDIGIITDITTDYNKPETVIDGKVAVAGVANLHSHAFQRAMAGLGEWAGKGDDSFWTWRKVMYEFVERLSPQDLYTIAAQAYVEMLESGFTAVGEFHYLHNQPSGDSYDNISEMSDMVMAAANEVGIAQTLLPVFYQQAGFTGEPVKTAQKRFYNDVDSFLPLVEQCRVSCCARTVVGIAPHSLRAVAPDSLREIVQANSDMPIHIHIAEQIKEVEDCLEWSGTRPVQWLFDNQPVNENWCLVHATHVNNDEITLLANSNAVAGICPITEANLGDGIFEGVAYAGKWGIGSDSNILINMVEELRSYEYSQRLRDKARNRLVASEQSNGRALLECASAGGAQALGQNMGAIEVRKYCDLVSLDAQNPALIGKHGDDWLNSWIFAGYKSCVRDVWVGGNHVVKQGRHKKRAEIVAQFSKVMAKLLG